MADRYMYIPQTGLAIIVTWGLASLTQRMASRRIVLGIVSVVVIGLFSALSFRQVGHWRNNISLYQHTIEAAGSSYTILNNLGLAIAGTGDLDAAIGQYRKALEINPAGPEAHHNLGIALAAKGDLDAAIDHYRESLRVYPDNSNAHYNLGNAFVGKGNLQGALKEYDLAIALDPDNMDALKNFKIVLALVGRSSP